MHDGDPDGMSEIARARTFIVGDRLISLAAVVYIRRVARAISGTFERACIIIGYRPRHSAF